MSESCNHNCGSCGDSSCGERQEGPSYEPLNEFSSVKKVIGVVSGKGGVGKSLVTSLSAIAMARKGYKTAILDADITGPSIPKIFGIHSQATGTEQGMIPKATLANGIKLMSTNLLLEHDTDPLVWRGPVIANAVTQFWHDVLWGEVDYMFIDMPPGTGDVPLTVFQSLPVDGILIVTSPQELVSMIVTKAVKMAEIMNIPVLGLVENMSYFHCPDNGKDYQIFGDSHIDEIAQTYHLDVLAKLPIDPAIAAHCDNGELEQLEFDWMDGVVNKLEQLLQKINQFTQKEWECMKMKRIAVACEGEQVAQHFGHCANFMFFDTEGEAIIKSESVANPGHKPGFLPNFLADNGAVVVLAGGMGGGAVDIFQQRNVEVVTGASGDAQAAVLAYLRGELKSNGAVCHEHQHHDECGEH